MLLKVRKIRKNIKIYMIKNEIYQFIKGLIR